ncbi:hypothetical protein ACLGIH_18555 [Streptomyces sp. HMX87]|uniref:hypothetical protein n=1 Tax=Streptomyces sp. HMX87 TaxID=3390849 RepID=UPI003A85423B
MGIESDQVVYEYLSRVGDVAQQRQLPSAARMRLVAELREEIDKRRSKAVVDSPAAVRRILDRLGSPDDVVEAAGDTRTGTDNRTGTGAPPRAPAAVPVQRDAQSPRKERRKGLRRVAPRPRPAEPPPAAAPGAAQSDVASPPHLAAAHELGGSVRQPDWWRVENSPFDVGDSVPGFVGGVEIPELLKPPPRRAEERVAAAGPAAVPDGPGGPGAAGRPGEVVEAAVPARRRLPRPWPEGGWNNPLLLFAAALLVAGAALGNLLPLALGWLITLLSRRLTPAQVKWAVLGLPGLVAASGIVWLWGRTDGRWGDPIADGHMNAAVADTWPWVLRGAALASALYLVWRARRPAG